MYLAKTNSKKHSLPEEKMVLAGIFKDYKYREAKGVLEMLMESINIEFKLLEKEIEKFEIGYVVEIWAKQKKLGVFGKIENRDEYDVELDIITSTISYSLFEAVKRSGERNELALKLSDIFYVKGLLFGLSAYLLAMLTDHHLLLSTQQFLFWFVLFIISSSGNFNVVDSDVKKQNLTFQSKCLSTILFASCFLVVAGHAFNMFYSQKKVRGKYEYGLYKNYQIIDGNRVRWAMKQSCTEVLATTDDFAFSIYAEPEKLFSDTLEVKIFANDNLIDQMTWKKKGSIHKYYHISGIKGKYLKISSI